MSKLRLALCSDPPGSRARLVWDEVSAYLAQIGWTQGNDTRGIWQDPLWNLVADPSGGTSTLKRLPEFVDDLPSEAVARAQNRAWWSMSDNSLVLNALIDRGLCRLVHGQPLTLAGRDASAQRARFLLWSEAVCQGRPFPSETIPPVQPLRGSWPRTGTIVGGNLTAMESLAKTAWLPKSQGRILLIESLSCPASHAESRLLALLASPLWRDVAGLLLGRFSSADRDEPSWLNLGHLPNELPVARWPQVGHGADGWSVPLGEELSFVCASVE